MSLLFGSLRTLPTPAPIDNGPVSAPPPPANAPATVVAPTITGNNFDIGTVVSRTIGTYSAGWNATAGQWIILSSGTVIGDQATQATVDVPQGDYVRYRETINNGGADAYAYSLPYGPFAVGAPAPPPASPPPGAIQTVAGFLDRSMFKRNHNGWTHKINGQLTADSQGVNIGGEQHQAYIICTLRQADRINGTTNTSSGWNGSLGGNGPYGNNNQARFALNSTTAVRYNSWFSIMDSVGNENTAGNTRVQVRNARTFYKRFDNSWFQPNGGYDSRNNTLLGSWLQSYSNPDGEQPRYPNFGSTLYDHRNEASNGGGTSLGGIGYGDYETWAFLVLGTYCQTETVQYFVDNVKSIASTVEMRLIKHNTNGTDDSANANLSVWAGGDFFTGSGPSYNTEHGHSSLQLITKDWQIFGYHSLLTPAETLTNLPPLIIPAP